MAKMLKTNQRVEEKWRQRWLEGGENDLRELKVKRWVHKPNIREEWACLKVEHCRGPWSREVIGRIQLEWARNAR